VLACNTALGTFPPECVTPDFNLRCDPVSLFCIQATNELPSLKADASAD